MRSVADQVREARRALPQALAADELVELALRLGDDDLAAYGAAQQIDRPTARRRVRAQRQVGRAASRCASVELLA
jgi:hypothetical protein